MVMTNIFIGTQRDKEATVLLYSCHVNLYLNIACVSTLHTFCRYMYM